MKRIILIGLMIITALSTYSVPALRKTFNVTQSNGEKLTLMMVGDEYLHYYINMDTGDKMQRMDNGDYSVISATDFAQRKALAQNKMMLANQERLKRLNFNRASSTNIDGSKKVGSFGNMTGNKKGLVILVNFKDKSLNSAHTQSTFNNYFNQQGYNQGGHIGSVSDYFHDQSYGKFNLEFDVVGPVTVSQKMSYYGGNDSNGDDKYPATMVIEACKIADQRGINFADYDWDGDGYVDQVYVIYAGYGENYSGADENTIWPHEFDLSSANYYGDGTGKLKLDGVWINTYACSSELKGTSGSTLSGIGTACHEFSHCLGYPDMYDTDYSGGIGMESFDVMCSGSYNGPSGNGEVPCGYTAYERWMAGWLEPEVLNNKATIMDMPAINDEPVAYIMYNDKNHNEYFMFENRQSSRWFRYYDSYTAGHGLFVTHIDYNASVWSQNKPNDDKNHQRVTWIAADGSYGTYSSSYGSWTVSQAEEQGDFFPGTKNKTALTATSHTNVGGKLFNQNTNGTYAMNHELTEIAESNGKISFLVDGGAIEDDGSRYTITLNPGYGTCSTSSWTQSDFMESFTLPSCTCKNADWTFVGWCSDYVDETTTKPAELLESGKKYQPTGDITLYAVYKQSDSGATNSGTYTLDYSDQGVADAVKGYGVQGTYTGPNGEEWIIKAYKNNGIQINKGKNASIKVPSCPAPITTIVVTDGTARVLSFSATDYIGTNNPSVAAQSAASTTATLNLDGKDMNTGYIYTTAGSTVITKVVVNYGGETNTYATYPIPANTTPSTVTFVVDGKETVETQTIAGAAISVPTVEPVVMYIDDEEVTYTFAGWTTTDLKAETETKPKLITATESYVPTADETLYAVFVRKTGSQGFILSITSGSTTTYIGAADAATSKFTPVTNIDEALTLYLEDGLLWYIDESGKATYAFNNTNNAYLTFSTTIPDNKWTVSENNNGALTFTSVRSRRLALNNDFIRCYATSSNYPYQWNRTYTSEQSANNGSAFYTCHPVTISSITNYVNSLKQGKGDLLNLNKMSKYLLRQ